MPSDVIGGFNIESIDFFGRQIAAGTRFQKFSKNAFKLERLTEKEVQPQLLNFRYGQSAGFDSQEIGKTFEAPIQNTGAFFFKKDFSKVINWLYRLITLTLDPTHSDADDYAPYRLRR